MALSSKTMLCKLSQHIFLPQAQSSAPKPGVWTPPAAPTAKPFTPNVQPPAPAAPGGPKMGPPRNPTGVNAVRAKKGEATIFKSGDSVPGITRIPVCSSCSISIRYSYHHCLIKSQ